MDKVNEIKKEYPQVTEWIKSGVKEGIPLIENQLKSKNRIDITPTGKGDSKQINNAIIELVKNGGGVVFLKNGTYDIDQPVDVKSNISIIGESKDETICLINNDFVAHSVTGAFQFTTDKGPSKAEGAVPTSNAGLYRLTIKGMFVSQKNGKAEPYYKWNINDESENNELEIPYVNAKGKRITGKNAAHENISVWFAYGAHDCWSDDLNIINCADFPIRGEGSTHNLTWRDLNVDGAYAKCGGCHGYFGLFGGRNLITGCRVTHIRHISIQGEKSEYNVVIDNDLRQEISFHTGDNGNNLIENNNIFLPADMPPSNAGGSPDYHAIMGPWSSVHTPSLNPNFLFNNACREYNHYDAETKSYPRPFSEKNVVYAGPFFVKPDNPYLNFLTPGQVIESMGYYDHVTKADKKAINLVPVPAGTNNPPICGTFYPINEQLTGKAVGVIEPTDLKLGTKGVLLSSGGIVRLEASIVPQNATDNKVYWVSTNPSVAGVDENGLVTAKGGGMAIIKAMSYNAIIEECQIFVEKKSIKGLPGPFTESFKKNTKSGPSTFSGENDIEWSIPTGSSVHTMKPITKGVRFICEDFLTDPTTKTTELDETKIYIKATLPSGLKYVGIKCHQTKWMPAKPRTLAILVNGVEVIRQTDIGSSKKDSAEDIFGVEWSVKDMKVTDVGARAKLEKRNFEFDKDGNLLAIKGDVELQVKNVSDIVMNGKNPGNMNIAIDEIVWTGETGDERVDLGIAKASCNK